MLCFSLVRGDVGLSEDDNETAYERVLKVLSELHTNWRDYQAQLGTEITEYKKTVNSAISILGMEAIKFQNDTRDRLAADASERLTRQQFVDSESARRETSAEQRRATDTAQHTAHQQRSDRKSLIMLGGMGCLLVVNGAALIALAAVLIAMYWRS